MPATFPEKVTGTFPEKYPCTIYALRIYSRISYAMSSQHLITSIEMACSFAFIHINMGRKLLIRTSEYPYHINARANNKEWFYLDKENCWNIFCQFLEKTQSKYNLDIHAFIMMSNHIHLIASTPDENIDKAMNYFMTMTSKTIGAASGRINRVWGTRYHRCLITTEEYYAHAFKYLYANPINAGIIGTVQDYKWSTLNLQNYFQYKDKLIIRHRPGFNIHIPEDKYQLCAWLNQTDDLFYTEQVRKALRKKTFKFSNDDGVKKYEFFKNFLPKK